MDGNIYRERIEAARALMRSNNWDILIITGTDPHGSEYIAPRWQQVAWLSGFTGEAGDIVITMDHAGLWTDTRYFIQANRQLQGTGIELHKMRVPEQVPIPQWIASLGLDEPTIAVDALCQSVAAVRELQEAVPSASSSSKLAWVSGSGSSNASFLTNHWTSSRDTSRYDITNGL